MFIIRPGLVLKLTVMKNDSKYIVHGSKNGLFKYDLLTLELYLSKRVRCDEECL